MAEFYIDCWNKINETNDKTNNYVISKDLTLCEDCGEYKNVIVAERKYYNLHRLKRIFLITVSILCGIMILYYWIFKYHNTKQ